MNILVNLKHNDITVANMELSDANGSILRYKCIKPELMPYLREMTLKELNQWWSYRAIPDNRDNLREILSDSKCETAMLYLLKNLALSLSDCYWVCPYELDLKWDKVNIYENRKQTTFSDDEGHVFTNNPNGSLNGALRKEAVYKNGIWELVKYSNSSFGEQSINEAFASFIHEKQQFDNYVKYDVVIKKNRPISCICKFFTSKKVEFLPAYNISEYNKKPGEISNYEHYILLCRGFGLSENEVREMLDYQTLTDFVLTNTDRHYSNFGVLRDSESLKFLGLAPIFDSGNSMFYKECYKMSAYDILNIPISAMAKNEEHMLEFVTNKKIVSLDKLPNQDEVARFYIQYGLDDKIANIIGENYQKKKEMLKQFQKGLKVSKYTVKNWNNFLFL